MRELSDIYNLRLNETDTMAILNGDHVKAMYQAQKHPFKVSISFGYILQNAEMGVWRI